MATAADLVDATLDFVLGGTDEAINVLTSSITAASTSLAFTYELEGIVPGAFLGIGLEVVRVVATNNTSNTATVIRGQRGSTAASASAGAVVQVNPRFSRWSVFRAINDDLSDLSAQGLYKMSTVDLTFNAAVMGYDLSSVTDLEDIYTVRYQVPGPSKEWPLISKSKWRLDRNANLTDFASGYALVIYGGGYSGQSVRVAYRAPFTKFTTLSDDVQTVAGLPSTANDLPPLGAAMRLMAGHEAARNFVESQPDTRRPDEVPPGAQLNTSTGWARIRRERIQDELKRLKRRYPDVRA